MAKLPALTRLLRLLTARGQRPLSIQDIRADLDCSEKSADRYIRELRDTHGYPIEYDREAGGYCYRPGKDGQPAWELPGLFFNESELSALITLRQLLREVQPGLFEKALVPLGRRVEKLLAETGVEPDEVARRIRILAVGGRPAPDRVFRNCADAVLAGRRLSVSYRARGRDGDWERRELSPQRLVRYRDNWYLDAWCHLREGIRVFALDQMQDPRVLETEADRVSDADLDRVLKTSYGIFMGEPTAKAVLRFTARRAQWVSKEDWHGQQEGKFLEDGRYELTVPYAHADELIMDILKHGPDVDVVSPPELRSRVATLLHEAMASYATP